MNGYGAQDMATQGAEGFRNGYQAGYADAVKAVEAGKPAAAQEAVAYLDIGAGGYLDLGSDLSDEQLLALPKGRHALAIIGTFGIDGYVAAAPTVTDPVAAYERELAAGATHEHALHAICTPAAPGIDMRAPRNRDEAVALARVALAHLGVAEAHIDAAIARCKTDASPKTFQPTRTYSLDILGNPMRQYEPGKWESARWPSDASPKPVAAPGMGSEVRRLVNAAAHYSQPMPGEPQCLVISMAVAEAMIQESVEAGARINANPNVALNELFGSAE